MKKEKNGIALKDKAARFFVVFVLLMICNQAIAQDVSLTGHVVDDEGQSLPGVTVLIKGTTVGTITNFDGYYELDNVPSGSFIQFSFVGMRTQEVEVGSQNVINVELMEDAIGLDEVVAIGYGVKKTSLVTGAISSIKSDELNSISSSRADQAIQGKTAGVMILPTSGSPGASTKIRIRGTNSNGDSNPLFIVDGMKVEDINNIEPSDIESIEVLKDAASSAIYGTEGANGVIIITTKMGKVGQGLISYDFQFGIQSNRSNFELMNAEEYSQWMSESGETIRNRFDADTNWLDEVFESAPIKKHNLRFSGGSEKTQYMLSGSYLDQDGILGGSKSNYKRYTARLNIKSQLKEYLQVGANVNYMNSKKKNVNEDDEYRGVMANTLQIDPLTPVVYESTPSHVQDLINDGRTILKNDNGKYYGLAENATGEISNPIASMSKVHSSTMLDQLMGTLYATITPFRGLSITSRLGIDLGYQTNPSWTPEYYFATEAQVGDSFVDDRISKWNTWLWENFASYTTMLDNHNLVVLLGYSSEKSTGNDYWMHSGPMVAEGDNYAYHHYTGSESDLLDGTAFKSTMASMFSRISYDYKNKYLLEASVRRDGASVFPTNNKYAILPAFSGGWIVSNEDFFKPGKLEYAKIRLSWGQNGSRANLPGNEDKELWRFDKIRYPDSSDSYQTGAVISNLINKDLEWERTEMIDFGVDLRFFNSKLSVAFDYYNKLTKGLITLGAAPLSVGNDNPHVNAGDVRNKGFDTEIGYRNNDKRFKYAFNLNLSTVNNNVETLNVNAPVSGGEILGQALTWFEQDYPIWYFKGYKTDGIDVSTGEPIVLDTNNDGSITPDDQAYIGDPHPDFLFGGNLSCSYEGFDLNVSMQGSFGNDVYMGWNRSDRGTANKPKWMFEERWTPDNPNASFSKADNVSDFVYKSDLMVSDGSYLRVKQIQLGYTVPSSRLASFGMDYLRVFASLENYFTITKYKGIDPEAGSNNDASLGVDKGIYPIAGTFLFGFSVNF